MLLEFQWESLVYLPSSMADEVGAPMLAKLFPIQSNLSSPLMIQHHQQLAGKFLKLFESAKRIEFIKQKS